MTNKIRDLDVKLDIISKLVEAIEKYPDERIGQILENSCISNYGLMPNLFYLEDRNLLQHLNKIISPLE